MTRTAVLARRLFDRFEPIHAVTYFAPEALDALSAAGYRGLGMGYFAGRSAPLGQVVPELVAALFHNFADRQVSRVLPDAWTYAPPAVALSIREQSAAAALRRYGMTDETARAAADIMADAAVAGEVGGYPMYAANLALPWPSDPVARLWHAVTLLREHRGDGHIAVLTACGISGRESNLLHAAAGRVSKAFIMRSRAYDETEWQRCHDKLARRGLLDAEGDLTPSGRALKDRIETDTDELALRIWDGLDDDRLETLFAVLTPLTRQVVAAGDVPSDTPMGLARHELSDDSAHLT